jgi:hypothetical protein
MASADFSDPVPSGRPGGSPCVHGPDRRPLEVRHAFFSRTRRIYPHDVCMTIGLPRRWPGYPRHVGLISACCTSPPRFRHQLSSDPASRRAPLPRRMVPVITVHGGLAPLECISLLDTPARIGCPTRSADNLFILLFAAGRKTSRSRPDSFERFSEAAEIRRARVRTPQMRWRSAVTAGRRRGLARWTVGGGGPGPSPAPGVGLQLRPLVLRQHAAKTRQHAGVRLFQLRARLRGPVDLREDLPLVRLLCRQQRFQPDFGFLHRCVEIHQRQTMLCCKMSSIFFR